MKRTAKELTLIFVILFTSCLPVFAQDEETEKEPPVRRKSKFLTGIYVGSYFANKYSASNYSGYGFDGEGNRNSWDNSFMNQKINFEYGYSRGTGNYIRDYIADAIGVDQTRWTFTESDMPFTMRYIPAIMVGANFKIPVSDKTSILVNVNGSKLVIEGNFTIGLMPNASVPTNPAFNQNILNFPIRGGEQRVLFQLGLQQLFGEDEKFNFLIEGGFVGTLVKFDKNYININDLQIDLTNYVNQTLYPAPGPTRRPIGFGIGAFAGLGVNIDMNTKINVQFVYTPSFEKVNIGPNPKLKLQNGIGLRAYYKL